MSFEKLPAIEGKIACRTCGAGSHDTLELDRPIIVGFGSAHYSRDGVTLWSDGECQNFEDAPTCADVEKLAALEPDSDWRIVYCAALYEAEYQRQGVGHWVLVRRGDGFA